MANETPRTKEKEVRTAEIEQAARKIFLSRGFQAATIQEIAEEARIAKGTVYLYYKSKEDLYTALLLPSLEFLNVKFNALLSEVEGEKFATGEELFEALADVFVELQQRDPEIAMIYEGFQVGTFVTADLLERGCTNQHDLQQLRMVAFAVREQPKLLEHLRAEMLRFVDNQDSGRVQRNEGREIPVQSCSQFVASQPVGLRNIRQDAKVAKHLQQQLLEPNAWLFGPHFHLATSWPRGTLLC